VLAQGKDPKDPNLVPTQRVAVCDIWPEDLLSETFAMHESAEVLSAQSTPSAGSARPVAGWFSFWGHLTVIGPFAIDMYLPALPEIGP